MAVPTTRAEFIENCLRRLGAPVIEINVDFDQVSDRVDEALRYFFDYHFDGAEKVFYKYIVTENDMPSKIKAIEIIDGGSGYSVNDVINIIPGTNDKGTGANAHVSAVNSNGSITAVTIDAHGSNYQAEPTATVTSTGSGASLKVYRGGYIQMPENIIGVVNIFDMGSAIGMNNLFNIRYQIALNDLYTLTSVSMVPYYMAMTHIQFLEQMLIGRQPLRYNRHMNKLYIDMDWERVTTDEFIVVEAYQVVDPAVYTDAWADRWLLRYASCLIKQQWGSNMKKFKGMKLPGGIEFNGQAIYEEATAEREALEKEMIYTYSLPATDMIG